MSICACIGREERHRNEYHTTARPVSISLVTRRTPDGKYTPVPCSKPGTPLPARFFPPPHYFHNPLHPPTKLLPDARILLQLQEVIKKTRPTALAKPAYSQVSPLNRSQHTQNGTTPFRPDYVSIVVVWVDHVRNCQGFASEESLATILAESVECRWERRMRIVAR